MKRREFLKLGAVATGTFAVAGTLRVGGRAALAQSGAVPAVDRLVMTNVVDNVYDIFPKGGKLDTISVQRTPLERGGTLLAEHGLAYHLQSLRGSERREILLDFSLTERNLLNNYAVLKVDPSRADALILSHGHRDHYGALPDLARLAQGKLRPGLTLHAGGEDTFCHRVVVTPVGTVDGVTTTRWQDRKSTRLNSSHGYISYAVFCLKKKRSGTTTMSSPAVTAVFITLDAF